MNSRYNTMIFLALYHASIMQLPWYNTTKFRGITPCFFSPCTNRTKWKLKNDPKLLTIPYITAGFDILGAVRFLFRTFNFFEVLSVVPLPHFLTSDS